jgi:hypothetical protein
MPKGGGVPKAATERIVMNRLQIASYDHASRDAAMLNLEQIGALI